MAADYRKGDGFLAFVNDLFTPDAANVAARQSARSDRVESRNQTVRAITEQLGETTRSLHRGIVGVVEAVAPALPSVAAAAAPFVGGVGGAVLGALGGLGSVSEGAVATAPTLPSSRRKGGSSKLLIGGTIIVGAAVLLSRSKKEAR